MSPGYSVRRIDVNQPEIVDELRAQGFSVKDVHALPKFADIVVGYRGVNFIFEIKTDSKKKLTPDEQKFKDSWKGQYNVITSASQAIAIIYAIVPPF